MDRDKPDLRLYFVLDPAACAGRDPLSVLSAALEGGVTLVQLRMKDMSRAEMKTLARACADLCRSRGMRFLINDHVDLALYCRADGVHLGQGDMTPASARGLLGPLAIIGQTAFTPAHMDAIDQTYVDYVGTGPFYPTKTDKGKPVLGADKFNVLAQRARVPVVGIGGITPGAAAPVIAAGAAGVAVMRAISEATDPRRAAQILRQETQEALIRRRPA